MNDCTHVYKSLKKIHASNVIVEAGFARHQIRNDGWPQNDAKPAHAGVVLYFRNTDGDFRFPCGTYRTFEANLHAIALTLENLRAIDRYGATSSHQQYMGFKQLEAGAAGGKVWTLEAAAAWMKAEGDRDIGDSVISEVQLVTNQEYYRETYRALAKSLHPDGGGRDSERWNDLQGVKQVLDAWHEARQ